MIEIKAEHSDDRTSIDVTMEGKGESVMIEALSIVDAIIREFEEADPSGAMVFDFIKGYTKLGINTLKKGENKWESRS